MLENLRGQPGLIHCQVCDPQCEVRLTIGGVFRRNRSQHFNGLLDLSLFEKNLSEKKGRVRKGRIRPECVLQEASSARTPNRSAWP